MIEYIDFTPVINLFNLRDIMDLLKKYFNNDSLFPLFSDYFTNYYDYVNERPIPLVLAPITITLFCYYVFIYVRKFYPIYVNCWFCNANFKVPFEDRLEYSCIECGQFNGFKKDGSYSKSIPEQHDQRYNRAIFSVVQEDFKENKNGLCNKCNIIQEMKVKQLASFTPTKEKYFDREIEKFKENLEATLKLCSKCNQYTQKVLSLQEQRYNLRSTRINNYHKDIQDIGVWPDICSLFLSFIVFVLSSGVENYMGDWPIQNLNLLISKNSPISLTHSIGMVSLAGTFCQVYHCLSTLDKLSAITMFLWSSLCAINNFEKFVHLKPKLLISITIVLLSSVSVLRHLTKKQKIELTSIKLEDEKFKINDTSKKCMSPKIRLRETHFLPGSSNQFIVRLPKFKVARVLNEKIFLEAIPKSIQYTTRDEYDYDIDAQYMTPRHNVQTDHIKIVMNQK